VFTVRPAVPEDGAAIAELNRLFNDWDEPAEHYAARLRDPRRVDTVLLAEMDGATVGIACLRIVPAVFYSFPYAELTELYVREDCRRRGMGRALVLDAERLARAAGAVEMFILTGDDNQPALDLYRGLGFSDEDLALHKHFE
jgi:ribosomal protein S18 acetylase RimI-like enzyme